MDYEKMTMQDIWDSLNVKFNENREPLADTTATYAFDLSGEDGGTYGLVIRDDEATFVFEGPEDFDCKFMMSAKNFKKLLAGNLNTKAAFMTRRMKIEGKIGYALKLDAILKKYKGS